MATNIKSALDFCYSIMKYIAFYHEGNLTAEYRRRRKIAYCVVTFMVFPTILGFTIGILTSENLTDTTEKVTHLMLLLMTALKCFNGLFKCEKISLMKEKILQLQGKISEHERNKDLKHLKIRLDLVFKNYMRFTKLIFSILLFVLMSTTLGKYPVDIFGELGDGLIGAWISAVFIDIACVLGSFILITINMLPVILIPYAIGFNDELAVRLKFIGFDRTNDYDELVACIKIHQMVESFVHDINGCFKLILYVQNIFGKIIISMFVFNLVYATNLSDLIFSIALAIMTILEILLAHLFGSELENSSENLIDAIYQSNWLMFEIKTKKLMTKFMENLKQPMQINCYFMFNINLKLFVNIMYGAYSFYCVLVKLV